MFSIFYLKAHSQNIPKEQQAGLRAPSNIKIDGKPTEWNNQFQAYSKSTGFFYTVANDDRNLYLVIYVKNLTTMKKFGQKGITFTIQKSGKKVFNDAISLTYPTTRLTFNYLGDPYSTTTADSLTEKSNKSMQNNYKEIQVSGVAGIDTISIYNEYNIKAACLFDNQRTLTYELAIPLKALGLSPDGPIKFAYNIRLNGSFASEPPIMKSYDGFNVASFQASLAYASSVLSAPTDVWGEYTLIK